MYSNNNNIERHLVIMAGGIGSRLWPISTPECPKQFVDILGTGRSLLQMTVDRFEGIVPTENIWIITSGNYKDIIYNQLPNVPKENILFEPFMRNTAPCIAYVGSKIREKCNSEAEIIISPADHSIINITKFKETICKALNFITQNDSIVTIGITPSMPHTGYGYIATDNNCNNEIKKVLSFKEKPSYEVALKYIKEGNYYWNSGLFLWKLSTLIDSYKKYAPDIISAFESIKSSYNTDNENNAVLDVYSNVQKISVDYAIMEKAENIYTLPSEFGWSDLGTWDSLRDYLNKDENGNAAIGNVSFINASGCTAHIKSSKDFVIKDLNNTFVIETERGIEYYKLNDNGNLDKI
ncbi:MAG: mannose-1-phosphate guanylyltransferase [Bacteroidales bacterium]|nr:mannose-1-phosphate guanylyltransferase [Bacteroidales bacterium]